MVKAQSPFASVARKIGNRRLEKVLAQLAANIRTEVHNAKHIPKLRDVRDNFRLLKGEAQRFEKALGRISLLDVPASAIECLPDARKTTRDISALCDKALSNISVKRGAPKRPGRVTCALIIIEAWDFERGRLPGANSPKAQEACADYWRANGGLPVGKEGDPGNWRSTLKEALADRSAFRRYIRDEIRFEAEKRSSELISRRVRNRR
ncbi:MAG TPA: hypothetical protein VE970_19510 [Pseudolabrys sp.]|nr:hypothetical protein [Pseudolabrys sp.]